MKHYKAFACVAILSCTLIACDAATPFTETAGETENILSLPLDQQRLAFNLLTADERRSLWLSKFDAALKNEASGKATPDRARRLALIREIRGIITHPDNYADDRSDRRLEQIDREIAAWVEKAEAFLSGEEIYSLLFELAPGASASKDAATSGSTYCTSCCCHVGSMMTCPSLILSVKDLGVSFGECYWGGCTAETRWGCGGGFLYACNGSECYRS